MAEKRFGSESYNKKGRLRSAVYDRELLRLQSRVRTIMGTHTGQTVDKISHDFDRDVYMDAYQAVEYGIVDQVIETTQAIPGNDKVSAADSLIAGALK